VLCTWLGRHSCAVCSNATILRQLLSSCTLRCGICDALQVQRLIARDGLQQEAALARVRSQMPLQQKLQLADVKVDNSGVQADLRRPSLLQVSLLCPCIHCMPPQAVLHMCACPPCDAGTVEELKLRVHQLAGSLRRVGFWHHVVSGPGVAVIAVLVWLAGHLRK
jgi:hypothetical protein